ALLSADAARAGRGGAVAVLAGGRAGPDGWPDTPLPPVRPGHDAGPAASGLRRAPLYRRDPAALRRAGASPGRPRLRRRRLFDRRHGHLAVDRAAPEPGPEPGRVPAPEGLVRAHRGARGREEGHEGRRGASPRPGGGGGRSGARPAGPVRSAVTVRKSVSPAA